MVNGFRGSRSWHPYSTTPRSLKFGDTLIIGPRELAGLLKDEKVGDRGSRARDLVEARKQVPGEAVVRWDTDPSLSPGGSMPEIARERSGEMTELSPGRVVILNGTSSVGKVDDRQHVHRTASCHGRVVAAGCDRRLPDEDRARSGAPIGPFGEDGVRFVREPFGIRVHVGRRGRRLHAAYHRTVAVCAREGFDVIVDDVCLDEEAVADWREALVGLDVTWVALRCDPDVAEAREREPG